MSRIRNRLKKGFTLVELMIVVAIVGVLAVLAVYGVRKYIANAKTAEAKNSLGQIGKDAVSAFDGERMAGEVVSVGSATEVIRKTCGTASQTVPSDISPVTGKKYQSKKEDWAPTTDIAGKRGFPCLKFEMSAPQYYMYEYNGGDPDGVSANDAVISAKATGDLDGNSVLSTFTMKGKIQENRLTIAPAIIEESADE